MQYTYGSGRTPYDGCINRDTPGRYVAVVPSFGDNGPAPRDEKEQDFFTEFDIKVREDAGSRISFGGSISSRNIKTRHVKEIRTFFWCATAVDPSGYVMEWGKCAAGCKADPAGTYLPAAPRRGNAGFTRARRGQSVGDFIKIIKAGNARNSLIL